MRPETKAILSEFGWHEGRQVSEATLTEWTKELSKWGIEPFDAAVKVLREFGDLRIVPRVRPGSLFMVSDVSFGPIGVEQWQVERWITFLGQRVYPIAESYVYPLFVAEDGKIYWECEPYSYLVGDTIYEALDALLIRDKDLTEVELIKVYRLEDLLPVQEA